MHRKRSLTWRIATFCAALPMIAAAAQSPFPLPQHPIPPPPLAPSAPLTISPAQGTHEVELGHARPTFTWSQGGWTTGPTLPIAQWFVVCLGEPAQVAACSWPGTWSAAATSIPRVMGTANGYPTERFRYTFAPYATAAMSNKLLNRDLMWNVGACASQNTASCSFASPKAIRFSTRNLAPTQLTGNRTSNSTHGAMSYSLTIANTGSSASGAFDAHIEFWQALENGGACVTDPAADGLQGNNLAILRDGRIVELDELAPGAAIEGIIHPSAMGSIEATFPISNLDPGTSTSVTNMPYQFPWYDMTDTYRAFVAVGRADSSGSVAEYDESDNAFGNCKVVTRTP